MILIFGGSYQGKLDFAKEHFAVAECECYDCITEIDFSYKLLNQFDRFILQLIEHDRNPLEYILENIDKFHDKIIVMTDISGGVVPLSPVMRKWREETGRAMVVFSKRADEVFRVYCGIAAKLK